MEVDIAMRTSWKDLQRLRRDILDGAGTTRVKNVKKLLMSCLADAIAAEDWQRDISERGTTRVELIVTIDLRVAPSEHRSSRPDKTGRGISLISQLDDAPAAKKKTRKDLLTW